MIWNCELIGGELIGGELIDGELDVTRAPHIGPAKIVYKTALMLLEI